MVNFGNWGAAPTEQPGADAGSLIPTGTLAWGVVKVRPYNLQAGMVLTPSKTTSSKYLDVEVTIEGGKHDRRRVWDKIGLVGSEAWTTAGFAAVRHIIEVGRGISSGFNDANPAYTLGNGANDERVLMDLDGMRCAVMIGIEKGKDGYDDKNNVKAYLSPNPESKSTNKHFLRLVAGDVEPKEKAVNPAPGAAPAWAAPTPAKPVAAPARPAWGGPPPPARIAAQPQSTDDDIPF